MAAMTASRMEAFSDGVIAVIVTIMVLELHVPVQNGWAGFAAVLPRLAIYALSYGMVGIYWLNHHELLRRSEVVNASVLWANLLFLFALSLVPFATDYVSEKHFDSFSAALYALALLLAGLGFLLLRHRVMCVQNQHGTLLPQDWAEGRKHLYSLGIYVAALLIAPWSPLLSFGVDTAVTLLWILPAFGTQKSAERMAKQHPAHAAPASE